MHGATPMQIVHFTVILKQKERDKVERKAFSTWQKARSVLFAKYLRCHKAASWR
jgi:hypothetical protein